RTGRCEGLGDGALRGCAADRFTGKSSRDPVRHHSSLGGASRSRDRPILCADMQSKATTVAAYLRSLPAERRAEIEKVRAVINANLDRQYEERMSYGMIAWVVPHSVFPGGYHCDPAQPLPFAGLASQKNHCSVYVPLVVPSRVVDQTPDGELHRWF